MKLRDSLLVLAGVVLALGIAELGMRLLADHLPDQQPWPSAETAVKAQQVSGFESDFDVLFLGSSISEAAIDPSLLEGRATYNGALPFWSWVSTETWVRRVLLDDHSADVVVIGVPTWPVDTTPSTDPLRIGIDDALSAQPGDDAVLRFPTLWQHRGLGADWVIARSTGQLIASSPWTDLGHQTAYYERSGESLLGVLPPYGVARVNQESRDALVRVVRWLEEQGTVVVFMIEPGSHPNVPESRVDEYRTLLTALANELDLVVWDMQAIEWDESLFADEAHFNRDGTVIFTDYVNDLLTNLVAS